MRFDWTVRALCAAALTLLASNGAPHAQTPSPYDTSASSPNVSASFSGPVQPVFDTRRQACEQIDIPDIAAHAFRDDRGQVHLFATHYVARAMVGPTLDTIHHECRVVYRSPEDPNPAHFQDRGWLDTFFSLDGRHIVALVHDEYQADTFRGMCAAPNGDDGRCWWNTIAFARSDDGGYTFHEPPAPNNLVASVPYAWDTHYTGSVYGYDHATNIVQRGGFYYTLITDWPYKAQPYGPCLIRTANPIDPASWRAWDGTGFTIRFVDPYVERDAIPEQHVCPTLAQPGAGVYSPEALVQDQRTGDYIAMEYAPDGRYGGPVGLYVTASRDLIHWSKPSLVARESDLLPTYPGPRWNLQYFSIIDPQSNDPNFTTVTGAPYVYYVRTDGDHPPYTRVLLRRRIRITLGE